MTFKLLTLLLLFGFSTLSLATGLTGIQRIETFYKTTDGSVLMNWENFIKLN